MGELSWTGDWYGVAGAASSQTFLRGDGTWSTVGASTATGGVVDSVSSGSNIDVTGAAETPTVAVSSYVSVVRLNVSSRSTLASLQVGPTTAASLVVSGGSTLGTLQAGASTCASLSVSGRSTFANNVYVYGTSNTFLSVKGLGPVGGGLWIAGATGVGTYIVCRDFGGAGTLEFLDNAFSAVNVTLPNAGGLTVNKGTLAASSGAVIGRTQYVPPGTNTLSAAVSTMANGACLVLDASTYVQSTRVKIPSSVSMFSIYGRGSANTRILYTADVEALVSTLSGTYAHRIRRCRLEGLQFRYECSTAATKDGIVIWAGGTNNVTLDPNLVFHDVSMVYGAAGVPIWRNAIRIIDARANYLSAITIRKEANGRTGSCIRLESCMNTQIHQFHLMCSSHAIELVRASSQYLLEHTTGSGEHHGCEDCNIGHGTVQICGRGVVLGYKAFACKIHDMEIVAPSQSGIYEDISSGVENGGYHHIHDVYVDPSGEDGLAMVHVRRPGSVVNACAFHLLNASAYGVIVDADASMNAVTNNIFRFGGAGGYAGCYINSSLNTVTGNRFEFWNDSSTGGADIYLGASAAGNIVAFNQIDSTITDASTGTTNTIQFNPKH